MLKSLACSFQEQLRAILVHFHLILCLCDNASIISGEWPPMCLMDAYFIALTQVQHQAKLFRIYFANLFVLAKKKPVVVYPMQQVRLFDGKFKPRQ